MNDIQCLMPSKSSMGQFERVADFRRFVERTITWWYSIFALWSTAAARHTFHYYRHRKWPACRYCSMVIVAFRCMPAGDLHHLEASRGNTGVILQQAVVRLGHFSCFIHYLDLLGLDKVMTSHTATFHLFIAYYKLFTCLDCTFRK